MSVAAGRVALREQEGRDTRVVYLQRGLDRGPGCGKGYKSLVRFEEARSNGPHRAWVGPGCMLHAGVHAAPSVIRMHAGPS